MLHPQTRTWTELFTIAHFKNYFWYFLFTFTARPLC